MTTLKRILFVALLSLSVVAVRAGQISGSYSNDCGSAIHLWDVSGVYSQDLGIETESMTLAMDASGTITGQGYFNVTDDYDSLYLSGNYGVTGKVKSAGTVTRVSLVFRLTSGSGTVQGYDVTFQMTLNENLEIDDIDRQLVGSSSGKLTLTVPAYGRTVRRSIPKAATYADLPDSVDGAWGLSLSAVLNGTKYQGNSVLNLSNGKSFDFGLTGTYSSKTDLSKLTLKATDTFHPINLNLVASDVSDSLNIRTLKGKAFGQNLKLTY